MTCTCTARGCTLYGTQRLPDGQGHDGKWWCSQHLPCRPVDSITRPIQVRSVADFQAVFGPERGAAIMRRTCLDCGAHVIDHWDHDRDGTARGWIYACGSSYDVLPDTDHRRQSMPCAARCLRTALEEAGIILLGEAIRTMRGIARAIRHGNRP